MSKAPSHAASRRRESPAGVGLSAHGHHARDGVGSVDEPGNAAETASQVPAYTCARRLTDVHAAWGIVYERYVDNKLIKENSYGIHTVPQAVGHHACVIHGASRTTAGSTFTLMGDTGQGLPLDSVYARELDALRWLGRGLVEVGLLARRVDGARRGARALFDMMCWAVHYTLHIGCTDIVIGVHPHHAYFYERCFGCQRFAPPTTYPLVNDNPVIPLRLALHEALDATTLPRGLAHIRNHPVDSTVFEHRFRFEPEQLRGSTITRFLANRGVPVRTVQHVIDRATARGRRLPALVGS